MGDLYGKLNNKRFDKNDIRIGVFNVKIRFPRRDER